MAAPRSAYPPAAGDVTGDAGEPHARAGAAATSRSARPLGSPWAQHAAPPTQEQHTAGGRELWTKGTGPLIRHRPVRPGAGRGYTEAAVPPPRARRPRATRPPRPSVSHRWHGRAPPQAPVAPCLSVPSSTRARPLGQRPPPSAAAESRPMDGGIPRPARPRRAA
ncbi:uncharacterized protein LOC133268467 [Pezoporus flaviventris]|uniref:uncharacterized protein LOC133268467 n=1 Tax=Pezoporus flaviventris TaxID=889875 RepID=UPI002AB237B0|nr:uncharacterized protein LOC133268467 [Pezoporus flaviventris]